MMWPKGFRPGRWYALAVALALFFVGVAYSGAPRLANAARLASEARASTGNLQIFLPFVSNPLPTPTPTAIPTIPIVNTATPPPSATATPPPSSVTGLLSITNDTGGSLTASVTGPLQASWTVANGQTIEPSLPVGNYELTAQAWCGSETDPVTISTTIIPEFTYTCVPANALRAAIARR
jgi:hypothetical protein